MWRRLTSSQPDDTRAAALRNVLYERHGWRWRYKNRWLLIAGDEPQMKRLAPELLEAGYLIAGDTVLLHAKQTATTLDTEWLEQIRRLRRRRPVDAIVVLAHQRDNPTEPFDGGELAQRLTRHARALGWAAPAYLLNATEFGSTTPSEAIGFSWARANADEIDASLQALSDNLADTGVARLAKNALDRYPAELSRHISNLREALTTLALPRVWRYAVHGLFFAPLNTNPSPTWQTIAQHSRKMHGRRVGFSLSTTAAWMTTGLMGCAMVGAMMSGLFNRVTIEQAAGTVAQLSNQPSLQTLNALDRHITMLETHQREGAPWRARFGLNRDSALLAALWPRYVEAASGLVVAPLREQLNARLHHLASLSDAEIANSGQVQAAYDTLKTYLMLAQPEHATDAFLKPQLMKLAAPARASSVSPGVWEDQRQHAITFLANHLGQSATAGLAIEPDETLIASTRQTVINVRGIQNSTEALYQQILEEAQAKYPPVSLATLLGDTTSRGLFDTSASTPGVFTRAAWEGRISKAIDEASEQQNIARDWVLSDETARKATPSTLKAELRQRYFDDYARAWGLFLNSLRWQSSRTLSATADQLTLLGDPQRSPLVALMKVITYQAGAGSNAPSLASNLISKAQQLVGRDEKSAQAPLAAAFGPILHLTGSDSTGEPVKSASASDLGLARYLERVTAMRLKASQIVSSADPDAMARQAAQSVLQGKTSELAESRDYASRLAASLGKQWSGFGELFLAPFDQTWQVVVQSAAASLNEIWRLGVVADWNRSFGGRYPFADSSNDASLPEMARFMRADHGVITQFVTTQLAGVIERQGDRWVAGHGALTIDPAFLTSLNQLTRISTVLFPSGDAQVRYELRAEPTAGVTDMKLVLSGRELHYFNQKQEWTPFEWPGQSLENLSRIELRTEQGGLRTVFDVPGRFGLIRLLEQAKVSQQDNARYLLRWKAEKDVDLRVQLRSEAGAGPLEVLQLRRFSLPPRIFITNAAGPKQPTRDVPPLPSLSSLPPLPPSIAAATQAALSKIE